MMVAAGRDGQSTAPVRRLQLYAIGSPPSAGYRDLSGLI
jgi:hypothetical protein